MNNYIFHHQAVSTIAVKTLGRLVMPDIAFSKLVFKNMLRASLQKGVKKVLSLTYGYAKFLF